MKPREFINTIRELHNIHPQGTHFCSAQKRPGYALDIESLNNLMDAYDTLKADYEKLEGKLKKAYRYALSYQLATQGGLAGQAFTAYQCLKCDTEKNHPNTNTPIFCDDCKKQIVEAFKKERESEGRSDRQAETDV